MMASPSERERALAAEVAQLRQEKVALNMALAALSRRFEESELWREEHARSLSRCERANQDMRNYIDGVQFRAMQDEEKRICHIERSYREACEARLTCARQDHARQMREAEQVASAMIRSLVARANP